MSTSITPGKSLFTNNVTSSHAGAILSIDLGALTANYNILTERLGGTKPSAVIKADGYGLGAVPIAITLANVGCRIFFVANLEEGIRLRDALNEFDISDIHEIEIHVLSGLMPNTEEVYNISRLIPVLGSLDQIFNWKLYCGKIRNPLPCDIHIEKYSVLL